jgi:hypothetical protein
MLHEREEETPENQTFARLIILIVPITATAAVLGLRLPQPLAWGLSAFTWMLAVYWFPPKPRTRYIAWILLSLAFALITSVLATVFHP